MHACVWFRVCACEWMHVSNIECVPQWCCGQQCPGTVVWTKERPGAQLVGDSGQRFTSQTETHGRKYKHDFKGPDTKTHVQSLTHTLTTMVPRTAGVGVVKIHSQDFPRWTLWNGFNTWLTHCSDRKHKHRSQCCCYTFINCQRHGKDRKSVV